MQTKILTKEPAADEMPFNRMKYFGYGSNLFLPRLRRDVPSAHPVCVGRLLGYTLRFHKKSTDGSGKCNAFRTGDPRDEVLGVVYQIKEEEKCQLDEAERGYEDQEVEVETQQGRIQVWTYRASKHQIDNTLKPYTWYKQLVVKGAKWHKLPVSYVKQFIDYVPAIPDKNSERREREERLLSMRAVTAWNNGTPSPNSGAGYGVKIKREDRYTLFEKEWATVAIDFDDGTCAEVNLSASFWKNCPELRHKAIGMWLQKKRLAPWRKGSPPYVILEPKERKRFRLSVSTRG